MIAVVDYGMGNLRNVRRAFEALGEPVTVTSDAAQIENARCIVLPGVGAFGEAVRRIDRLGLREVLLRATAEGKPFLGICLGMQLLFGKSQESPGALGLGILGGKVVRFGPEVKVPHIGWNDVVPAGASPLFPAAGKGGVFYFVHSFYVPDSPAAIATTTYGIPFVSAVRKENILGVQFHPEKSQSDGMDLLRHFLRSSVALDRFPLS